MGISFEDDILSNTNPGIRNPITAFNFVLEVEGVFFLPIKSVRAFTKENEYEYIKEGGVNDYVHMKRKPISKPFTFQIERYVGTERAIDPLANGTELVLPLILHVYRHAAMQGFSKLPDAFPARLYTFTGCTVISKEYGELNSERSSILTEITTIAYRELMVVTNPFQSSSEKPRYNYKTDKTKLVNATQSFSDTTAQFPYEKVNLSPKLQGTLKQKKGTKNYKPAYSYKDDKTTNKWADKADNDKLTPPIYKEDKLLGLVRSDSEKINKPAWDGKKGSTPYYAKSAETDKIGYFPYVKKDIGKLLGTWFKKEGDPLRKLAYEYKKDKTNNKWARQSESDKENKTYTKMPDGTLVRTDAWKYNKPAWTGAHGSEVAYATQAETDKMGYFPYVQKDIGELMGTWVKKEGDPLRKLAYSLKLDKTDVQWAKPAENDGEKSVYKFDDNNNLISTDKDVKLPWDGSYGTKNRWAQAAAPDKQGGTYTKGENGELTRIDKKEYNKPAWTGEHGATVSWAAEANTDKMGLFPYVQKDIGELMGTWVKKEGDPLRKLAYSLKLDKTDVQWAKPAENDGEKSVYKFDDNNNLISTDKDVKLPWDGSYGTKNRWAQAAAPDKQGGTYSKGNNGELTRIDKKKYNKPAWTGKKGTSNLYAEVSIPDKANATYKKGEDGVLTRVDKKEYNKPAWTGEHGSSVSYATEANTDKNGAFPYVQKDIGELMGTWVKKEGDPLRKLAYSYKEDKTEVQWAKQAENDKGSKIYDVGPDNYMVRIDKQAKAPWDGKSGTTNKWAEVSKPDKLNNTYTKGDNGEITRTDEKEYNKPAWTGEKGATVAYATEAKSDANGNFPYVQKDIGELMGTWVKKEGDPLRKLAYSYKDNKTKVQWAKPADNDANGNIYSVGADNYMIRTDKEAKAPWDGKSGTTNKWAQAAAPDKQGGTYSKGNNGEITRTDNKEYNKPAWTGEKGATVAYAAEAKSDANGNFPYVQKDIGELMGTWVKKEGDPLRKLAYSYKDDKTKVQWAKPADNDANGNIYSVGSDNLTIRTDKEAKAPWDGSSGTTNKWAQVSAPDKLGNTYTKGAEGKLTRTDDKEYNKPQYELKKYLTQNKYAKVSTIDKAKPEAKAQYEMKKDLITNKWAQKQSTDSAKPEAKAQYEMKKDLVTNKWAQKQSTDSAKPEAKAQYELKKDLVTNKWAQKQSTDSVKPEEKAQYELKKDLTTNKWAQKQSTDSAKPEEKAQYEMSKDATTNKWAQKQSTDSAKPEEKAQYEMSKDATTNKWAQKQSTDSAKPEEKAQYEMSKDATTNKWAQKQSTDSAKPEEKAQYEMSKDATTNKWAQKQSTDSAKPEAKAQYEMKKDNTTNKWAQKQSTDSAKPEAKAQYELAKDNTTNKWAQKQSTDSAKPEAKAQYELSKDSTTNKWAQKQSSDSAKAEAKAQYEMSKDQTSNKWAQKQSTDGQKPEVKAQYELAKDQTTNKWAKTSPKDKEKAQAVTWPPTRRALMADALSKK